MFVIVTHEAAPSGLFAVEVFSSAKAHKAAVKTDPIYADRLSAEQAGAALARDLWPEGQPPKEPYEEHTVLEA